MRARWAILVLLLVTIGVGCGDSLTKPEPEGPVGPTSIANLLANLIETYTTKDLSGYRALFDTQNYTFHFAPQDAGHDGIPQSWGLADELASADSLFTNRANKDGYRCDTIQLAFQIGTPDTTLLNPAWTKVTLSQVRLAVSARNKDTGDPLIYEVNGDQAVFYLVQNGPVDAHSHEPTWRIVRWDDKPVIPGTKAGATKNTTWGQVKALFR